MRVLITGVTGYIGSHLARALLPDHEVWGLVREPLHTEYIAEFREQLHLVAVDGSYAGVEAAVREAQPELTYHLATYYTGSHGPEATPALVSSNITFGAYLLEAMSVCGCGALAYASTVMAHYGGAAYRPLNLYAATKQAFSDLLAYYTDAGLMRAVTLVISDTYGPGDRRSKVLNLIRQAVLQETALDLTSGRQIYDAVYIDDVVQGFICAASVLEQEGIAHRCFQLAADKPCSLRETVELMLEVNDLKFQANWGGRPDPDYMPEYPLHIFPAPPGWKPCVTLEDGLWRFWNSDLRGGKPTLPFLRSRIEEHFCEPGFCPAVQRVLDSGGFEPGSDDLRLKGSGV